MPQLQNLYRSILGVTFDRRNFANKVSAITFSAEVDDGTPRRGTRTPIRYGFDKKNYDRLKESGFQLEILLPHIQRFFRTLNVFTQMRNKEWRTR